MPDLSLNIIGNNLAGDAIKGFVGGIKSAGDAVAQFAFDSVKMYAESQKAVAQLNRVAGDSTDAFVEMATQLQNTLGVSDDMVIGLQRLTLQFGAAQTQVEPTTRAILDYAAATGKDATQAMEMLIRGVDGGTGEIKKLGISFEATGDRTKDLASATAELAKKYGGAAAADAATLAGSARIATATLEDLKKALGGLITDFITSTGVIDKVTFAVKELQYALSKEKSELEEGNRITEKRIYWQTQLERSLLALKKVSADTPDNQLVWLDNAKIPLARVKEMADEARKGLAELQKISDDRTARMAKDTNLSSVGSGELTTGAKEKAKQAAEAAEEHRKTVQDLWREVEAEQKRQGLVEKRHLEESNAAKKAAYAEGAEALAEAHLAQTNAIADQQEALQKSEEAFWTDFGRTTARGVRDAREGQQVQEELDKTEQMFAEAGMQIGLALANEIASAMEEMLSGGEVDAGEVFGDIVATILAVAGTAIGAVVGNAGGAAVGGAIGSLAGSAVRSATRRRKRHDGGWSDAEQYHSGGWPGLSTEEIPAVLQAGERVLSRQEVGRMGGRAGVDAAARGGGPQVVVQVAAIDTKGVREAFSGDAGRGVFESIQSGRGDMARLFGMELVY